MAADKKGAKPSEDAEGAAGAGAADDGKKKKKKILLIVGLVILLIIVSVGATIGAIKLMSPKNATSETVAEGESDSEHGADAEHDANAKDHSSDEPTLPVIYYALKPNFTVNYDVSGRQRFLQAELTVVYRDPTVLPILELHMPAVRNGIVLLLSSQLFDDLQTIEGKEKLRAAALKVVQGILTKEQMDAAAADKDKDKKGKDKKRLPNVEQILFTNFVMQ